MRMIDADALLDRIPNLYERREVSRWVDEAPTAYAVPVRHGRWTDKDGGIATCSVCGDRWGVWSVMKYCPSCGAKMDGKDGDND